MTKGPDYTIGLIEPPRGEKKMDGYVLAVYTKEQMDRLNVDMYGKKQKEQKKTIITTHNELFYGIVFYCIFFLSSGLILKYNQNYNSTGDIILITGAVIVVLFYIINLYFKIKIFESFFNILI